MARAHRVIEELDLEPLRLPAGSLVRAFTAASMCSVSTTGMFIPGSIPGSSVVEREDRGFDADEVGVLVAHDRGSAWLATPREDIPGASEQLDGQHLPASTASISVTSGSSPPSSENTR